LVEGDSRDEAPRLTAFGPTAFTGSDDGGRGGAEGALGGNRRSTSTQLVVDAGCRQCRIRAFIEDSAGTPASVIEEVARTISVDLVVLGRGHKRW
jgi:hypothetical protein